MINKISEKLNEKMQQKNTIYVLKGFNSIINKLNLNIEHKFNLNLNQNINNITKNDLDSFLSQEIFMLQPDKTYYCLYEELFLINKFNILGLFAVKKYNIEIIDIGIFANIYPGFIDQSFESIVSEFEKDDNEDSIFQSVYTEMYLRAGYLLISYNNIETDIKINEISLFNSAEEDFYKHPIVHEKEIEFLDNSSPCLCVQLFNKIFIEGYNKILLKKVEAKTPYQNSLLLTTLNSLGVNVCETKIVIEKKLPERYEDYLKILRRKNPSWNFKEINIYKDAFVSNEIEKVNQSVIIDTIYQNIIKAKNGEQPRDIFVTAPTGAGKSVLFQIPAILAAEKEDLLTLVISPLIGLMKDQVENIKKLTDCAATINSEFTPFEKEKIKNDIKEGKVSILYISPETLLSNSDITTFIGDRQIGLLVVDEAHTVATWGKNFRPDYWYLGEYIDNLRHKTDGHIFPIATFTATATIGNDSSNCDMYHDIVESLNMTPISFIGDVKRNNIDFSVNVCTKIKAYDEEKNNKVVERLNEFLNKKEKTLVYFPYISKLKEIANELPENKGIYYGGLDKIEKNDTLNDFRNGTKNMVLATKAFGMGIDIEDIKYVYHFAPTGNLADYVQEIGRAARKPDMRGLAITDYYDNDFRYIKQLYGMSAITNYNIIGVLKKILYKYEKENKRNFLVSVEDFAHVFTAENDGEIENKLKATMLAIKKDFIKMSAYTPLIFKPKTMFTRGLFFIPDSQLDYVKQIGWYKYLTKKYNDEKYDCEYKDGMKRIYLGSIYEFDFKKCWQELYNDKYTGMTFGTFKRKFYLNELPNFKKNVFQDRMLLSVVSKKDNFEVVTNKSLFLLDSLKDVLDDYKMSRKHFSAQEIAYKLSYKLNGSYSQKKVENFMEQLLNLLQTVDKNSNFGNNKFINYNSKEDRYYIVTPYYYRLINSIKETIKAFFGAYQNQTERKAILTIDKQKDKIMRSDMHLVAMQILELFELVNYTISAGDRPEFFVRVNSEKTIRKVADNPNYKSQSLYSILEMHEESVNYMKFFFEKLNTNEERWQFIEDYFLGRVKEKYQIDVEHKTQIKKLKNLESELDQYKYEQSISQDVDKIVVYSLYIEDEDITKKYYIAEVDLDIDAIKLNPIASLSIKLKSAKVGSVINHNDFEYLVEKIETVKIK